MPAKEFRPVQRRLACMGCRAEVRLPFRNEHAARQLPPEPFVRFARKQLSTGVYAVLGIDEDGRSHVQSVRFDKRRFTPAEARSWLARHGFRTELEEARDDGSAWYRP